MKINVWGTGDWLNDPLWMARKDITEGYFVDRVLEKYLDTVPPLSSVEIETINRCNGTCSFCPVSVGNDKRPYAKMSDELFFKIIDNLAEINYTGFVSLFSNNEPMLDPRFIGFLSYAREKLPMASHGLFTNGSKIARGNFGALTGALDYLYIDNYSDDLEVHPHLQWLVDEKPDEGNCHIELMIRKKTQVLNNRGGNAPNKQSESHYKSSCILPFMQMVIRPDGRVSLCCQDAYGDTTLGDLRSQSITEVWTGEPFSQIRRKLIEDGRAAIDRCQRCDLFGFHNYFPAKWVDDYARVAVDTAWGETEKGKKICVCPPGPDAEYTLSLLRHHGLWDAEIVPEQSLKIFDDNVFVLFTHYLWDLLDSIDPIKTDVGSKYLVINNLERLQLRALETAKPAKADLKEGFYKVLTASRSGALAVFGAGETAKALVTSLSLEVQCYLDNSELKQNSEFMGKPVIAPKDCPKGYLVLIAAMDEINIRRQLIGLGKSDDMIVSGLALLR